MKGRTMIGKRMVSVALALASGAGLAATQVPVDVGIRMSFGTPGGADLVDPGTGISTPVTGLSALANQINAGSIDPVTGDVWLGGILSGAINSNGQVRKIVLAGSAVMTETLVVDVNGSTQSLKSIDYDRNGDIYTCDQNTMYKIGRATGMASVVFGNAFPGTLNALCVDMAANKAWLGTFSATVGGEIIEVNLGTGIPVSLGNAVANGFSGSLSGLDDDENGLLYVCSFSTAGQSIYTFNTASGVFGPLPAVPAVGLNDVWYNRKNGKVHAIGAGANDDYFVYDPVAGATTQVTFGATLGTPANVAVNDFAGRTEFFPQAPTAGAGFTFEGAAHGGAGDIGVIAVVAVNGTPVAPILVAFGLCDSGGFFKTSFPVAAGIGAPGDAITIQTATIDLAPLSLLIGNTVNMGFQ
jgi:hypothetical protein